MTRAYFIARHHGDQETLQHGSTTRRLTVRVSTIRLTVSVPYFTPRQLTVSVPDFTPRRITVSVSDFTPRQITVGVPDFNHVG